MVTTTISTKKYLQGNHVALAVHVVATAMTMIVTLSKKSQPAGVVIQNAGHPNGAIGMQSRLVVDVAVHATTAIETALGTIKSLSMQRCQHGTRRSKA